MAQGTQPTLVRGGRRTPRTVPPRRWPPRGAAPPAAVAAAFTLAQLLLVRPTMGLGWDEIVYVSQAGDAAPAAFFSAPRARGVSLLVWPVASWSSSTALLRVYLAVLSGLGLHLALRAWRGLFPTRVLAGAGAFFATLWVTLFYGPQAMPNLWVAFGALICVGCFLRARAGLLPDRRALWGVFAAAALMAWMRPTDAVWVTVPLLLLAVAGRHRRLGAFLAAGLAAGALEWVVEAYAAYGGLRERLNEASRIQGDLGWNLAVDDQMRSLAGITLCRPCNAEMPYPTVYLWWFALPLLAGYALTLAVRAGRTPRTLLPLACATTAAVPYLFLIGYAAPRFLLPAYALLALPVADALAHLLAPRGRWRPVAAAAVGLALAGHLTVQYVVLERTVARITAARVDWARSAAGLHRLGVRPPCLLTGYDSVPVAYYTGCASGAVSGHNANTTLSAILRTTREVPVGVLSRPGGTPPRHARDWPRHRLAGLDVRVAPAPGAGGPE
ncbi:integral membrane protein [Streptomyces zinciresistens K42]|uniref:Integral membrane protein n=1 Tax=Streptomyces zinciresistens K42 TaxID=700597 RepID=G2GPF1_9ACTN|nr:hypothetical protein [Streptomyces zinciresistens]EGX54614.1 integral membrane protein [Streptomyces zinciresistens K42]